MITQIERWGLPQVHIPAPSHNQSLQCDSDQPEIPAYITLTAHRDLEYPHILQKGRMHYLRIRAAPPVVVPDVCSCDS